MLGRSKIREAARLQPQRSVTVLGIDPGATTGIALIGPAGLLCRSAAWGQDGAAVFALLRPLVALARGPGGEGHLVAVVEVSDQHYRPRGVNQRSNYKIAMNVGQCAQKAAVLCGFCRALELDVVEQRPLPGRTKRRLTPQMWSAMFPDYKGRPPNNHCRDAACLADREYRRRRYLAGEKWS